MPGYTRGPYKKRTLNPRIIYPLRRPIRPGNRRSIGKIRRFLPLSGFPEKKLCKLRYVETITLADASTPGLVLTHPFSVNSCYDPNALVGGHQPYGFDQWALIYNHYKVLGSKMTLRASNVASTQAGSIFGIKVDDDASVTVSANSLMEQKDSKYEVVVGQNAPRILTKKWSLRKTMDPTDDGVSAQVGASPADQEYFVVYASAANQAATLGSITFQVQIDYIVQFHEMKDFANS